MHPTFIHVARPKADGKAIGAKALGLRSGMDGAGILIPAKAGNQERLGGAGWRVAECAVPIRGAKSQLRPFITLVCRRPTIFILIHRPRRAIVIPEKLKKLR